MPESDRARRDQVWRERRRLLLFGPPLSVCFGLLTFGLTVPTLAALNAIGPYLPWIAADGRPEPVVFTAWLCARFATGSLLAFTAFLFAFVPRTGRRG